MNPIISAIKRFIKQRLWLYNFCLGVYFLPRNIKTSIRQIIPRTKRFIKQHPWVYSLFVRVYLAARNTYKRILDIRHAIPTRRRIRDELAKNHTHLFLYATHVNAMLRGHVTKGLSNLTRQVVMDFHNWRIFRRNKLALQQLNQLYKEAILCCIQHRVNRWWDFLPDTKFDSIPTLQVFLLDCLLHRSGDYNEFLRIKNELNQLAIASTSQEDCFHKLARYYAEAIENLDATSILSQIHGHKRPFLIALPVWGDHYVSMFLNYCLPSLLAEGNLPALCKERAPILYIHTNAEGKDRIDQAEPIARVKSLGIIVRYQTINEKLVALFDDDSRFKYWHLGMVQSLDLYLAKAMDADFHLLLPDTIYSEKHFSGILRAVSGGQKVVTRLGLSTRMEGICPAVNHYRCDGVITIPAADLAALSVAQVHSASWSWIATAKDTATELPNVYMIVWEGKDTLHMLSAHQTILYLDREVVRAIPKRFYMSLDSELDKIVSPDCPIYQPRPEDEIYLVEVTPEHQRPMPLARNPIQEFARLFWHSTQASMAYWRIFDHGIVDPLNREMIQDRRYMTDEEIRDAKHTVKQGLLKRYPQVTPEKASFTLEILDKVRAHPKAKQVKNLINETEVFLQSILSDASGVNDGTGTAMDGRWSVRKQSSNVLEPFYQEAILCCIRHRVHKWWTFLPNAKFDSVAVLQAFLRECVLRRAGDYNEFRRIRHNLKQLALVSDVNEEFFDEMTTHYLNTIEGMDTGSMSAHLGNLSGKRPFLIAVSVWGKHFIEMFLNYCLPSLLAEGNLGALCKARQPIIFIHTNPLDKEKIDQAEIMHRIKSMGVVVIYQMVNEKLVSLFNVDAGNKYWHLGMVQSIDLHFARTLGADYHLLMPDTVYSDNHFAGLLRAAEKGHKAIIRLILSTRMEGMCPALEPYRKNGAIAVPVADLAAFSVAHIHSASLPWIITNQDIATEASNSHVIVWEGKESVHIYSPHQTILYLDREVVQKVPKRFFMTLDSELDKIIPKDCAIYCPKQEDGAGLIEMTSEKQRPTPPVKNPIKEFCRLYWYGGAQESMAYWRIFNEGTVDLLNRDLLSDRGYMEESAIAQAKHQINQALLDTYPVSSEAEIERLLALLEATKSHPEAVHAVALMEEIIASTKAEAAHEIKELSAA